MINYRLRCGLLDFLALGVAGNGALICFLIFASNASPFLF